MNVSDSGNEIFDHITYEPTIDGKGAKMFIDRSEAKRGATIRYRSENESQWIEEADYFFDNSTKFQVRNYKKISAAFKLK